ncbi:response regulator transcription factor [Aliiglaciecola sp. CAU 1673]|uniref:response regulator transcription factor n=1 Tax=Aliiglaciecola sp. CAU 1673 TaxID=3032595 RepID=UPI0023DC05D0|nr:response regulator transcription factor [Aliiglaciecola sp. CAU 1673]MDF2180282.1 response regulator transcription factor [Aliiglaciecola sp. CAU 1673]
MKNVLMIDDDRDLSARLQQYFSQFDIKLQCAETPSLGLSLLAKGHFDLLLLDVMLPEKDGFTLCKEIRQQHDLPIIMLTARGELTDKVLGLEIGADDYLPKPFEPRELVARIDVLLRRNRAAPTQEECWRFDELCLYPQQHKVELNGEEISLTGMEFRCLRLLAEHPGQVFNRDELLNELRGIDADVYSRSIDILLSRLRQKLGDDANAPKYIKTLRNVGYCFVGKRQ